VCISQFTLHNCITMHGTKHKFLHFKSFRWEFYFLPSVTAIQYFHVLNYLLFSYGERHFSNYKVDICGLHFRVQDFTNSFLFRHTCLLFWEMYFFLDSQPFQALCYFSMNTVTSEVKQHQIIHLLITEA
jgi:hypothetical protein